MNNDDEINNQLSLEEWAMTIRAVIITIRALRTMSNDKDSNEI